jgi:hypothetical protein
VISVCEAVEIISPYNTRKADDESATEEKSDKDALAEGKLEFQDDRDGDHDHEEVGNDVDDALEQEMRLLINTLLGYQREGPVCCDGSGNGSATVYLRSARNGGKYLHWKITTKTKTTQATVISTIATAIAFRRFSYPVVRILRVRKSIESLVQVLAIAKRIWLASASPIPGVTSSIGTSQAWRSHP